MAPGLPRFWISHQRRAPPGAVGPATRRWCQERTRAAWGDASARPVQGALGRCLPELYTGTLPLHLYAQVQVPPNPTGHRASEHATMTLAEAPGTENTSRTYNLEGLVARLRGYVGGSYTHMLHRHPAFEAWVSEERGRPAQARSRDPPQTPGLVDLASGDEDAGPEDDPPAHVGPPRAGAGISRELLRCCPRELHGAPGQPHPPARWNGSLRHVALLCTEPQVTLVREGMWDVVEQRLPKALRDTGPLAAAGGEARGGRPAAADDPEDLAGAQAAPALRPRPDNRRRPAWTTLTGESSQQRWPTLTAFNWQLPLCDHAEEAIASGRTLEGPWDLGYRGLIPRGLAARLKRARGTPAAPIQLEERAILKRIEKAHRRTLTRQVLPATRAAGGLQSSP